MGQLNANSSVGPANSIINLTFLGTADWAHWSDNGTASATPTNRKATGGSQISNATGNLGGAFASGVPPAISWSDGSPTANMSNATSGFLCQTGVGNKLTVTVPADTNVRTVYAYFGLSNANTTLTLSLSDGSAANYSANFSGGGGTPTYVLASAVYAANSANQTLSINMSITGTFGAGSFFLTAVALANGNGSIAWFQQAALETAFQVPANTQANQAVLEVPYQIAGNIDVEQSVIEVAIGNLNNPDWSGSAQVGLPGYVPTTLFLWEIQDIADRVFNWRSQYISHGLKGYQHIPWILASYVASDTVTLSFQVFDGTAPASISLPSTAGQLKRIVLVPTFNKFRLIRYIASSTSPFQILLPEWRVKVGEWGRTTAYVSYQLLGEG